MPLGSSLSQHLEAFPAQRAEMGQLQVPPSCPSQHPEVVGPAAALGVRACLYSAREVRISPTALCLGTHSSFHGASLTTSPENVSQLGPFNMLWLACPPCASHGCLALEIVPLAS